MSPENIRSVDKPAKTAILKRIGQVAEWGAHALSISRAGAGMVIAKEVERTPEYHSWKLAGIFAGAATTDLIDGWLARFGRKLQKKDDNERRIFNAYIDKIPDKVLVDSVGKAIANREHENGHEIYASVVKTSTTVDIARNVATTADSILADYQGIDTRAIKSGKWKAFRQYGVETFALTPLADSTLGRSIAGIGFVYSATESVTSGIELHQHLQQGRENAQVQPEELLAA